VDWNAYVRQSLAAHQPDPDEQVILEIAEHARTAFEAERADGRSQAEAEASIRRQVDVWCRDTARYPRRRRRPAMIAPPPASAGAGWAGWMQDARYGARLLFRQWPFTLAAIVTTALGIGAAGTLFSVAYGVLAQPLSWPAADRLVRVWEAREGGRGTLPTIVTNRAYAEWTRSIGTPEAPSTIDAMAAWVGSSRVTIGADAAARRVLALPVSANLFGVLGVQPAHGRGFDVPAAGPLPKEVVLSHGLWLEHFGGNPGAVGAPITIDGESYRIAGVMPERFFFPTREVRLWLPYRVQAVQTGDDGTTRSISMFNAVAHLRPGRTADQAAAEATARARGGPPPGLVDVAIFGTKGDAIIHAMSFDAFVGRDVRQPLLVFLAAVLLLFLTAISSISSLQLARSTARRRELALRAALGAGARRLARQLLVESTLLGLMGGLAGVALMIALHAALPWLLPDDFPRAADVSVNVPVLAFAVGAAIFAGLAFGMLPALQTRRLNLASTLTEDGTAPVGAGRRSAVGRWRAAIMTGQVAAATVLLIGAALLARTFVVLWNTDRGYEPRHVLTTVLILPDRSFKPLERTAFLRDLLARVENTPGVAAAGVTSILPLSNYEALMGFRLERSEGAVEAQAGTRTVSPGYFDAMGLSLADGRWFTPADTPSSDPVVVVNRTFAATYLTGRAVGQRLPITLEDNGPTSYTIAGVIDDVLPSARGERPRPEIYGSYLQLREGTLFDEATLVVRTDREPDTVAPVLRRAIADLDRRAIVEQVVTMEDRLRTGLARPRLYAVLLGAFSGLAVLIAGTGLFGMLAYNVAQRRREIGVRAALGASPRRLVTLVVRQSAAMTIAGLAIGLAVALVSSRWLSSFLFGISDRDVASFVAVPLIVLAVAAVASAVPARRAAAIDPLKALRG
jgi:putative ABC transport system permease protein